jgi:hypothetical protein
MTGTDPSPVPALRDTLSPRRGLSFLGAPGRGARPPSPQGSGLLFFRLADAGTPLAISDRRLEIANQAPGRLLAARPLFLLVCSSFNENKIKAADPAERDGLRYWPRWTRAPMMRWGITNCVNPFSISGVMAG